MDKIKTNLFDLHNITMADALSQIKKMSVSDGVDIIVTPNIDHLVRITTEDPDGSLKKIYQNAALCLCDSNIFDKMLIIKGKKIKEVIPGSTLTQKLFDQIITTNDKILIIGGNDNVITKLRTQYNTFNIVHYNPPMGFINNAEEVDKVVEVVTNTDARYLFLAVGSPRQELVAQKLKSLTKLNCVTLCIGASILFLVGEEKRAPVWIQKLHLEWMFRMIMNPGRLFKRYVTNILLLPTVFTRL